MIIQKKILALAVAASFSTPALAQENPPPAPPTEETPVTNDTAGKAVLNPVVVTATRTEETVYTSPASVTVVNQTLIDERQSGSLKDILENIPNVEFSDGTNTMWQRPSIRGVGENGVIFLIDGARQNYTTVTGNSPSGGVIDAEMLKQVEVKAGSGSVLYGGGGVGGVISLKTKDAKDLLRPGEQTGGSYRFGVRTATQEVSNTLAFYGQYDNVGVIIQGTYRNSNNITTTRPGAGNHVNRNGDRVGVLAKVSYAPTAEQYVSLTYTFDNINLEGVPKSALESENEQHRLVGNYELSLNELVNLKAVLQGSWRDYSYRNNVVDQSDEFTSYGLSVQNTSALFAGTGYVNEFTYGIDSYFDEQKGLDGGVITDGRPHAKSTDIGLFAQDKITLAEVFDIIPAARLTYYERSSERGLAPDMDDTEVTPSITFRYTPVEWFSVFTSYSEAYRPPSMDELYTYISYGSMGEVVPNPDLRPESAKTWEAGFNINKEKLFTDADFFGFKFVFFDQTVKDMMATHIDWGVNPGDPFVGKYINVDRGERRGVELMANYHISGLDIALAYGKTLGRNRDTGERTGGSPDKYSARVAYTIPDSDLTPFWRIRFVDRYEDSSGTYGAYAVQAIGVTWTPAFWRSIDGHLAVSVDNIFDKRYQAPYGGYELGRGLNMTVGFKF